MEEAGLETEGMAETTSQLQAKLQALTHGKVDILIDADTFKNTTQILREMSGAWEEMTDMERAAALELLGGKRQANILSSLIANFDTVEQVIETSMNSAGSAYEENAKWLDSIEGKTTQLTNAMQAIWNDAISSEAIKYFLDIALGITEVVDKVGLLKSALAAVAVYLAAFKGITPVSLFKDFASGITKYVTAFKQIENTPTLSHNGVLDGNTVISYANAVSGLSAKQQALILTTNGLTTAQVQQVLAQNNVDASTIKLVTSQEKLNLSMLKSSTTWRALGASIKTMIAQNPIMFFTSIATVLTGLISKIETTADKTEKLADSYGDLRSKISETESSISSIDSELETLQGKIDELESKGKLSLTDAEELALLKSESAELERQKGVQEQILAAREQQDQVQSKSMIDNLIATSAAGQAKAAETYGNWGKAIGTVAGAAIAYAIGAALAPATAGASFAIGAGIGGAMVGASGGSKLGEWLGYESKEVDNLTEWYDSYTEAINKANQEAQQAESEYLKTLGDTEYEKWQSKVEAVNTLQTEMYDGLQEMQSYINNLEYDDQTKGIIDEFNNLMTHISVTSMDGDINAQIQSLEALKSEYAELSKGVDENGNNIALSAQEYARYQAIVSQLLGYNTGLTQTFDENGSAIKDANGNLVSYNSALTTTIELLKQQQQLAAKNAVGLGDEGNSTFTDAFNSIINSGIPEDIKANFLTGMAQKAIKKVTGEAPGFWDSFEDYVLENIDNVRNNKSKIEAELINSLRAQGYSSDAISQYVSSFSLWFDDVVSQVTILSDNAKNELKNLLYIVPQASDSYYNGDLSGNSLNFINDYIDTYVEKIEDIENLTDDAKTKIRDNILALTDAIGNNPELQEAINELFTLDSSSMSISDYKSTVESQLSDIFKDQSISGLLNEAGITSEKFLEALIPNQKQIDTMVDSIQSKFKDGYNNIRDIFTQKELEIVFKATVNMADGSMDIDKFKDVLTNSFAGFNGPIVQTSSAMKAEIESFNDIIAQTGEILIDNTEVTKEYKDALIALGVDENELNEYFYDSNKLVVKNADGLKKLVKQTTSLSKAQAQLQYYNLVKRLGSLIPSEKNLTSAELAETSALIEQISKLQQAIYQYQLLEDTLLGASNAFKKFAEAQEIDAQNTYGDDFVSMAQSIYDAYYLTGKVGTEQVNAAVEALIDPSVYAGLEKNSDAYHNAIYKAFNNRVLPTLTLDEDNLSLEYDNIEKFVSDNLGKIFEGTSVTDFDLAEGMNLDTAIEKTGKTRTELYALFAELQKYTGENYLLQLDDSTSGQITKITSQIQNLNEEKLALLSSEGGYEANKERISEINNELAECQNQLSGVADQVRETWDKYCDNEEAIAKLNEIQDKTTELNQQEAAEFGIQLKEDEVISVQEALDMLQAKKIELSSTPVELQVALDDVESDLATAQEALKTLEEGGTIDVDLNGDGAIDDANTLKGIIKGLENEKATITLALQTEDGADIGDKADEVIRQLSIMSGVAPKVKLGADNTDANQKIDETKSAADELDNKTPEVNAKAETTEADSKIENTVEQVSALDGQTAEATVEIKDEDTQQKLSDIDAKIDELNQKKVEIYSNPGDIESHTLELTLIEARLAALNNKKAKITAEAEVEAAKQGLTEVEQQAEELASEPVTVTVLTEADTASLLDKLQDFQSTYETLKTTIEIGADTTAAEANFQAAVSALNQESPEVLAKLGIDMTSSSAEINAVISSLTPEIMVNCGLNKTAVDEFVGVEHTATGTVTWNNNHTAIDEYIEEEKTTEGTVIWDNDTSAVDSWMSQNLEVDGTVNWYNNTSNVKTSFTATGTVTWSDSEVNGTANASGTAHVNGTAFKGGSWGAPRTETALVGELGPEMLVRDGRWTTIGEGGAEFTQIKKGDIIFNHKQTEQLLSQGHITGRGKAYASGTAYAGLWSPSGGSSGGSSGSSGSSSSSSDSSDSSSDAGDEFEETLDWIEILLEEINEQIDLMSAKIENTAKLINKNNLIDDLIDIDKNKMAKLQSGITKYANYAAKLLSEVPASYRKSAQDGAIAIEEFVGEADEKTVEAIRNYREWAQKVADLKLQLQETKTEIADLAKQKFDNISDRFGQKISIFDKTIEQFEGLNDTAEAMGLPAAEAYYKQMITYSKKRQDALVEEQWRLQDVLDTSVKNGDITVYDDRWYEMVEALYEVDIAIQECVIDMEEYQNAINEIYWDNLDDLISRLEGASNEAQNLINLMDSADMVITPESENGWTADQVEWTKEGIASLGLYAQQMEMTEYTAKQYEQAINKLHKDYQKGLYSESEYIEKLNELKDAQYDSIEAYYDARSAIVDLNKTRVDSIKKGIEKEIDAYEKLIEKKKEALESEKD